MNNESGVTPQKQHVYYFDHLRNLAMFCVVLYHSVIAYGTVTGQFPFHDSSTFLFADIVRWLFDVFMMPLFFFIAGYFTLGSLAKRGVTGFLSGKLRRLGLPWVFVMAGVVVPLMWGSGLGGYFREGKIAGPADELTDLLKGFFRFRVSSLNEPQMHLWFIPVLLFFFLAAGLVFGIIRKRSTQAIDIKAAPDFISRYRFALVAVFALILSVAYFLIVSRISEINIVYHLGPMSFEPAKLPLNAGAFLLGILFSRIDKKKARMSWEKLPVWSLVAVLSLFLFFVSGKPILDNSCVPAGFPAWQLLLFSLSRNFLAVSILMLLVIFFKRNFNTKKRISSVFAENSFNIYLIHMFPVFGLQAAFMNWETGPAWLKLFLVFFMSLLFSFLISNFIVRKYPKGTAVFLTVLFVVFALVFNPHGCKKTFDREQAEIKSTAAHAACKYARLRERAEKLYVRWLDNPDNCDENELFRLLAFVHYMNEADYGIQAYLGHITVVIGDGKGLPVHMVHDSIGYKWLDGAAEQEPENLMIRYIRGRDSFSKPDVFAERWKYARLDFEFIRDHAASDLQSEKKLKEAALEYLARIDVEQFQD